MVKRFLEEKSPETEVRRLMATAEGYDPAVWEQMANELALQALGIPEEFGGQGFGPVELYVVFEEMGAALMCSPYFSTVALAANAVLNVGNQDDKERYLPGIATGERRCGFGLSEPQAGSDVAGMRTRAVPDERPGHEGDWILSGTKCWMSGVVQADWYTVFAKTGDPASRAHDSITCFIVERGWDGVSVGGTEGKTILALNNKKPPLDQLKVRQAIAYALDRKAIIDGAVNGIAALSVRKARALRSLQSGQLRQYALVLLAGAAALLVFLLLRAF